MKTYYLYRLHPNGHIASRDDIEADDDARAIAFADQAARGSAMELWEGARLVRAFPAAPPVTR